MICQFFDQCVEGICPCPTLEAQSTRCHSKFMDAIGAFVNRRNPRVSPGLGKSVFRQIAISTKNLDAQIGGRDASFCAKDFAKRRQELDQFGPLATQQLNQRGVGKTWGSCGCSLVGSG